MNLLAVCFSKAFLKQSDDPCFKYASARTARSPDSGDEATIYIITPTYARPVKKAELTRLSHTLLLASNIVWILVEDSSIRTDLVTNFIATLKELTGKVASDLIVTHLNVATPPEFKTRLTDPNWLKPRGVLQRNEGLEWIRERFRNNKDIQPKGAIYFADDDNTYDLKIFDEIRDTKRVSVWPVGLVGGLNVEKPLVEDGHVIGWNTLWQPQRNYPVDMAGFALNLDLVLKRPQARFTYKVARGHQESHIIGQLIRDKSELEPKASNCSKVLVWHTRTENPRLNRELRLKIPSNHGMEL